jgi:hypothetical protein
MSFQTRGHSLIKLAVKIWREAPLIPPTAGPQELFNESEQHLPIAYGSVTLSGPFKFDSPAAEAAGKSPFQKLIRTTRPEMPLSVYRYSKETAPCE